MTNPAAGPEIITATLAGPKRLLDSVRTNPVWQREMLQAFRMSRTPLILMTLTILLTVITCAIGGVASSSIEPAELGSLLYHVFFSLCFAVVCWVGPGTGTLLVTAEHTNRTWDALLLTGMSPRAIGRGKFMAAISYVGMYLVMLAPIGAIPFITGGVTAGEVLLAFVILGATTALAVGFGTCVGAAMKRAAPAMLVSIVTAMSVSLAAFFGLGIAGAAAASSAWPGVVPGAPVWLPTAYLRADFGWQYVGTLVFAPWATVAILACLFQEITVSSLTPGGGDRLAGLKRWALAAYPTLCAIALVIRLWTAARDEFWIAYAVAMAAVFILSGWCLLLVCTDDLAPSRRVRVALQGAPWLSRALQPGIARSVGLVSVLHVGTTLGLLVLGSLEEVGSARVLGAPLEGRLESLATIACTSIGFVLFCAGWVALSRARARGPAMPRVLLLAAFFVSMAGPWLLLAIAGLSTGELGDLYWLAAPSPSFSVVVVGRLLTDAAAAQSLWWVQLGTSGAWALLGVGLFVRGRTLAAANADPNVTALPRLSSSGTQPPPPAAGLQASSSVEPDTASRNGTR